MHEHMTWDYKYMCARNVMKYVMTCWFVHTLGECMDVSSNTLGARWEQKFQVRGVAHVC